MTTSEMSSQAPEPLAQGIDEIPAPPPPREGRATRILIALLGASLLFGPWVAYATGSRSDAVPGEKRTLAPRPEWNGFKTFDEMTAYAADHFPLRDAAIRANKRFTTEVFGEDPSYASDAQQTVGGAAPGKTTTKLPDVLKGSNNWLYFYDDFRRACKPDLPLSDILAGVRRLDTMLRASGRDLVITVPPDKSTVDPQFLPDSYTGKDCSAKAKAERWRALAALDVPGYLDVRTPVEAQERKTGVPAYLPFDTHWTELSSSIFVQAVADKLSPALATGTRVTPAGTRKEQGDLASLIGDTSLFTEPGYDLVRRGVTSTSTTDSLGKPDAYDINHFTSTTTGPATLFAPRTVWIGDSFTQRALPKIWPYFADLTRVPELTKAILAGKAPGGEAVYDKALPRMLKEITSSKVVVLELVERTFAGNKPGSPFTDEFLDSLEKALAAAPKKEGGTR